MTSLLESAWTAVPELTTTDARALESLGESLAVGEIDEEGNSRPSVIQCTRDTNDVWRVRVNECVGVIGTETHTWIVEPKIPLPHLVLLLQRGGALPRNATVPVHLATGASLFDVLFNWFLTQVEHLIRRDLLRGYTPRLDQLRYVRGSIDRLSLSRGLLRGQTGITCKFEDFDANIAINRILKSALLKGLRTGRLGEEAARRSRRLLARFEGIDEAHHEDLFVTLDRQTQTYAVAHDLARQMLRGIYRELAEGDRRSWCFLWPTPKAVESGIRDIVRTSLHPVAVTNTIAKGGPPSFQADLVIGNRAVGDVKYSLDPGGNWRRNDLYQLLAFGVAYRAARLLLINFSLETLENQYAIVGDMSLMRHSWSTVLSPEDAEVRLALDVRSWLYDSSLSEQAPESVGHTGAG